MKAYTYRDPRDPRGGDPQCNRESQRHLPARHRLLYDPVQGTISKHTRLTEKDLEVGKSKTNTAIGEGDVGSLPATCVAAIAYRGSGNSAAISRNSNNTHGNAYSNSNNNNSSCVEAQDTDGCFKPPSSNRSGLENTSALDRKLHRYSTKPTTTTTTKPSLLSPIPPPPAQALPGPLSPPPPPYTPSLVAPFKGNLIPKVGLDHKTSPVVKSQLGARYNPPMSGSRPHVRALSAIRAVREQLAPVTSELTALTFSNPGFYEGREPTPDAQQTSGV